MDLKIKEQTQRDRRTSSGNVIISQYNEEARFYSPLSR